MISGHGGWANSPRGGVSGQPSRGRSPRGGGKGPGRRAARGGLDLLQHPGCVRGRRRVRQEPGDGVRARDPREEGQGEGVRGRRPAGIRAYDPILRGTEGEVGRAMWGKAVVMSLAAAAAAVPGAPRAEEAVRLEPILVTATGAEPEGAAV